MKLPWSKKIFYKQINCLACNSSGKIAPIKFGSMDSRSTSSAEIMLKAIQGICLACNGTGKHNIIDRIEK